VKLVQEAGKTTGLLRCPYHAWCYSTEGPLKQTPHVGGPGIHEHPDIDKSQLGLVEVRSHTHLDVVFVNISGDAEPFDVYFKDVLERWKEFDKPIYHGGGESSFKLEISKLEDHANILSEGPFSGQLTRAFTMFEDENGRNFSSFEGLSERWDKEAEYITFYPNVMFGVHKDHTFGIVLEPKSSSQTVEHIELYYASNDMRDEEWDSMRQTNAAFWKEVFMEDVGVVEAMQMGRKADGFDGRRAFYG